MKAVVVNKLRYRYPETDELALKDISFEVEAGEFIGIIGQNLSGKSTLCQAIVGLVPHFYHGGYGGTVWVGGLEVGSSPIHEIIKKAGIVFQNPFTQVTGSKWTVYEEIAFGLENLGVPRREMIGRIDHALHLMDMYPHKDRAPFELSGGQMQRMAIAGIIAMRPQIIVLDEPTSQLDPRGSEEVFRAIQQLSREGITIILAEHKLEKIAQYADRVLLLHEGQLIEDGSPQKIFSRSDLSDYGMTAPIYTQVCKALNARRKGSEDYPVTLDEAYRALVIDHG